MQCSSYISDYFVSLSQTPAMTIVANVIIKTTAAGSGVLGIGKPSATVYPVKSIIPTCPGDSFHHPLAMQKVCKTVKIADFEEMRKHINKR